MNADFYREFFALTLEICLSIFIIIFGYAIWDNFDTSEIEIAKKYSDTKEIQLYLEDENEVVLSNNENDIKSNTLYLHNLNSKANKTNLVIKINKDNELFKNNTILKLNNKYFDLKTTKKIEDNIFYYILLDEINFKSYETKELDIKILTKEEINTNINEYLNYEFITKV